MSRKDEVLSFIKNVTTDTPRPLEELVPVPTSQPPQHQETDKFSKILTWFGAGIVVLGFLVLIGLGWEKFSPALKIAISFGGAVGLIWAGIYYDDGAARRSAALALYVAGSLLLPIGVLILLLQLFILRELAVIMIPAVVAAISYGLLLRYTKFNVFVVFCYLAVSVVYATLVAYLLPKIGLLDGSTMALLSQYAAVLWAYATIVAVRPLCIDAYRKSAGWLYFFGLFGFFSCSLFWFEPYGAQVNTVIWNIIYPIAAAAIMYASIRLQSKLFLIIGSLALTAYVLKITAQYFAETIGWPIAMIIFGLLVIGIASQANVIRQRFVRRTEVSVSN